MSIHQKAFLAVALLKYLRKMSPKPPLQLVQEQAKSIRQILEELKSKLHVMNEEYNAVYAQQLRDEQKQLRTAVEDARKKLIHLEVLNGVSQVPIPNTKTVCSATNLTETKVEKQQKNVEVQDAKLQKNSDEKGEKPKKEKKPKEAKPKTPIEPELPIDIGRLDLRIAKIEEVQKHPNADTLYVLKINCGEDKLRTVCSGLVKQVPIEELQNRLVMLLCNLKPVKMRGVTSEAMVMCASSSDNVEVLIPPNNCEPGDLVYCDGYTRQPDSVMSPKKKIFETVALDLHTNDNLEACYKGIVFNVPGKGNVVAKTLKNVPVK